MGRVTRFIRASNQQTVEMPRPRIDSGNERVDHDLQRVIASWPTLPRHVRSAILTLIASVEANRSG
jgi:hypothetical protein